MALRTKCGSSSSRSRGYCDLPSVVRPVVMTKPMAQSLCSRCRKPRGYRSRAKGLCKSCEATCPACEERFRSRGPLRVAPYCNPCANALQQAALCVPGAREKLQERCRKRHKAGPAKELWRAAKARAKRKGLPFDLEVSDIVVPAQCPVLGVPLVVGSRKSKEYAPSLDRVVPNLGYVRGNVRVISYRANTLRRDASIEELESVLRYAKGIRESAQL